MLNKRNDDLENRRARAIALLRTWEFELGKEENEKPVNEKEINQEYNEVGNMMSNTELENYPIILTAAEISEILKVLKPTAYELMKRTDFPLITIGRSKRVLRDSFFQWLINKELNTPEELD